MFNYEMFARAQKIGTEAYVAENVSANYLFVKNCCNYSRSETYYKAFVMAAYAWIKEGSIDARELKKVAADCAAMTEEDALTAASVFIAALEISAENNSMPQIMAYQSVIKEKEKIRNAVRGVLSMRFDHPVYKAVGSDGFQSLLNVVNSIDGEEPAKDIALEKEVPTAPPEEKKAEKTEPAKTEVRCITGADCYSAAETVTQNYIKVNNNNKGVPQNEIYFKAFMLSADALSDKKFITRQDVEALANSMSGEVEEALTDAAAYLLQRKVSAEFDDADRDRAISFITDIKRNMQEVVKTTLKGKSAATTVKDASSSAERKAAASTGSETVTLNTQLKNRKKKIGETLFTAEFLAANYYYTEHYRNYSCWEQLYFTAFIMSAYDLLDDNILTPEGLKSLAKGGTEKDAVDALTDAVLYFAQCRINAQNEGYKKEFALQDMVSQKDAVRKSIISVLKKGEKHPIFRASDYYDKKLLYSKVAHYAEGMTFTPVQSERTHSPAVPVGNAGRRVKKVFVFIGIISLHFIGNVLVNMGRNAMIASLNVWDSGYFIKIFFITMFTVVAYLSITTPLAIRYLIRYAREN